MTNKRRVETLEETLTKKEKAAVRDPALEAEQEKIILSHPDSRRIAHDLLQRMVDCARSGNSADQDAVIEKLKSDLHEIGGGYRTPLALIIRNDAPTRELAYQLLDLKSKARRRGSS